MRGLFNNPVSKTTQNKIEIAFKTALSILISLLVGILSLMNIDPEIKYFDSPGG